MKSITDKHSYDPLRGGGPDDEDADSDLDVTMDLNESDYLRPPVATRRGRPQWRRWWPERSSSHVGAFRWGVDALLLLVIVGLLVERQWGRGSVPPAPAPDRPRHEGSGDVTGFAPQCKSDPGEGGSGGRARGLLTEMRTSVAQQIRTFTPEPIFMPDNTSEFFSPQVRQKWLDIVPRGSSSPPFSNTQADGHRIAGLGYLNIKDPQTYHDLPQPLVGYDGHVATTSMTHQLHCLV